MPAIRSSFNTSIKAGNQMLQVISSTSNTSETHQELMCTCDINEMAKKTAQLQL